MLFFEQVKELIKGMDMREAILTINYWCASRVTYQASDGRTASPIGVYRASRGRCGEESTFVVSVLRSAGIPARQVYVPLWSHCDDNHAWAEVWCDGEWKYLGACEPEGEQVIGREEWKIRGGSGGYPGKQLLYDCI